MLCCFQLPVIGVQAKMIPYGASLIGVMVTAYNYFSIIFVQGGVGKSRSTVAVRYVVCTNVCVY